MKKRAIFALCLTTALAVIVWAAAPWGLFGDATAVKEGAPPNPWAIQLRSDMSLPIPYGGVSWQAPGKNLTFAQILRLSTDFNVTDDDCGGGSPRFQINIDMNGDGVPDGNVFVYLGPYPNFTGCATGWQSSGNLIGIPDSDKRYDLTQVGGPWYGSYSEALALVGNKTVLGIQLVVDSGWMFSDGEQTVLVDNVRVNEFELSAKGFSKK